MQTQDGRNTRDKMEEEEEKKYLRPRRLSSRWDEHQMEEKEGGSK